MRFKRLGLRGVGLVTLTVVVLSAVGQAAAADPIPTIALQVWLDAGNVDGSNNFGLSDGASTASWYNRGTGGIGAFATTTTSYEPTLKLNILNSKPVVRFDGSNDALSNSTTLADSLSSNMTIFAVADSDKSSGTGSIVSTRNSGSRGWDLRYQSKTQLLYYHAGESSSLLYHGLTDQFNIIQLTRDGGATSAAIALSHNGGTADTSTIPGYSPEAAGTSVGNTVQEAQPLEGDIAELIIYDRVLSQSERHQVGAYLERKYGLDTAFSSYAAAVLDSNPVAYYRFEDPSSAAGQPASNSGSGGSSLNGTYHGNVALVDGYGYLDEAASLNGTTDYLRTADNDLIDFTDEITIETWVNRDQSDLNGFERLVDKEFSNSYSLTMNNGGHGGFADGGPLLLLNGNTYTVGSQTSIMDGQWHHVVATYDGENMRMYVDGELEGDPIPYTGTIGVNANNLGIGATPTGGTRFCGLLDEVALYGRALTPEEVYQHYMASVPEPTALVLLALGGFCLAAYDWRKRSR